MGTAPPCRASLARFQDPRVAARLGFRRIAAHSRHTIWQGPGSSGVGTGMEGMKNMRMPQGGGPAAGRLARVLLLGGAAVYGLTNSIFNVEGGHRCAIAAAQRRQRKVAGQGWQPANVGHAELAGQADCQPLG